MSRPGRAGGLAGRLWNAFDGLAGDTLWSGAHDAFALVASLVSFTLVTRALNDTAVYGEYVAMYGLLGAVGAFTYSGVGLALLQRLVGERSDGDESLRSHLSLGLIAGVTVGASSTIAALAYLELGVAEVTAIVVAELLGAGVTFLISILIQGASGFAAATRVRFGPQVIRLGLVVLLYLTGRLTILNLGLGAMLTFAAYNAYLLVVHLPRHGYRVSFGRPTLAALRSSALFSVPMGASKIQTDGDKFLLAAFGFKSDAGLYGAAYRVILLGITPLVALEAAAFQRFLPRDEGRGVHLRRATHLAGLTAVVGVAVMVALHLVTKPLLELLVEEKYQPAIDIVPWLLPLVPVISTSGAPLNGLLGLGRARERMLVSLGAAFVSVAAYFVMIPLWSWRGAVAATYLSELALAAGGWATLWHYQRRADAALGPGAVAMRV